MQLLTQGGEADIYEVDTKNILRVVRKDISDRFKNEKIIFPILQQYNILTPKLYDYLEIENKQAELMERIKGITFSDYLIKNPFTLKSSISKFAQIHSHILKIETKENIPSIKEIMNSLANNPLDVEEYIFNRVMEILDELPDGDNICHGDFHPGNILVQDNKNYIIDWGNVHRGNYLSDIAHTYLLLSYVPKTPGQSKVNHLITWVSGKWLAKIYFKKMKYLLNFQQQELEKWLIIMSLFRLYFGLPSEKKERYRYLKQVLQN